MEKYLLRFQKFQEQKFLLQNMSNAPTVKVLPWIITDFHWLWSKGRVIYRPRLVCQAWHHVITRLLKDYKIRMRTKQRGKKQSKASVVEPLKKWHATFREQCICSLKAKYNPKWVVFYQCNVWVLINHFLRFFQVKEDVNTWKRERKTTIPGFLNLGQAWTNGSVPCKYFITLKENS